MLRDCNKSDQEVWKLFIPTSKWQRFLSSNLQEWVNSNVEDTILALAFIGKFCLYLQIGTFRKLETREHKFLLTWWPSNLLFCHSFENLFGSVQDTYFGPVNGKWFKPPPGYLKLNVDGCFCDGKGTYEGVLRDEEWKWISGFKGNSNAGDWLNAEILALRAGINALVEKD